MHSYAETFEQPVVEKIDGKDVTIPLLSQRDYLPWIAEVTETRKKVGRDVAPTKAMERAQWLESVENMEVTPAGLQHYVFRAGGTIRVLELALKKAGVEQSFAEKWIDARGAKENEMLAVRVSGLFRREEVKTFYPTEDEAKKMAEEREKKLKEKSDPNESEPANQSGNGMTGTSGVQLLRPAHAPTF